MTLPDVGANTGVRSPAQRLLSARQAIEGLRAELDEPFAKPLVIAVLTLLTFALVRLAGGAPSALMELGFVPVVLAASAYGWQGGLATGVAVAAALGPAPALLGFDRVEGPIDWLIRAATFGAIGALVAPGLERLRVVTAAAPAWTVRPAPNPMPPAAPEWPESSEVPVASQAPLAVTDAPVVAAVPTVDPTAAMAPPPLAEVPIVDELPLAAAAVSTTPPPAAVHPVSPSSDPDTLVALSVAAESRDMDAGEHLRRISLTSQRLAERAGLSAADAADVGWAAMLHDLGKSQVPDRILQKAPPLDADEWIVVRLHPMWGEEAIGDGDELALARQVARSHHENWDGTGYPDGRYGDQIPLAARIVRITDAFDAMTHQRPYQRPVSFEAALEELQANAGTDFDPALVPLFTSLIRADPALRAELTTRH